MFQEIQDWQKQRLGKFTASEIHKLLQKGKSKSEYFGKGAITYIEEKISELITGQPAKELTGFSALEWGNANEYEGLLLLQEAIGIPLDIYGGSNNKFIPFNDYSGGSPDAETEESVVEAKCPFNPSIHISNLIAAYRNESNEWMYKNRPEYYAQLQFNMLCAKKDNGLFVSYDPRPIDPAHRLAVIYINKDSQFQSDLIYRIEKAAEIVSSALDLLYGNMPVMIAHHDHELNTTIVEPEFNLSKLKKISS